MFYDCLSQVREYETQVFFGLRKFRACLVSHSHISPLSQVWHHQELINVSLQSMKLQLSVEIPTNDFSNFELNSTVFPILLNLMLTSSLYKMF